MDKLSNVVADFDTQTSTKISAGDTTVTIQSVLDDDGNTIPNGIYFLNVDGNISTKEHFLGTLDNTTGIITGVKTITRQGVQSSGFIRPHRVGAPIKLTDFATLYVLNEIMRGNLGMDSTTPLVYDANFTPTIGLFQVPTWDYVKAYADALAISGSPDASTTVKGISKLSTSAGLVIATPTITIASPAVITSSSHGLIAGDTVKFTTTGALPTGITSGTNYYVISAGLTTNTFEISVTAGGSAINTSGSQSGTHKLFITTPSVVGSNDYRLNPNNSGADTGSTDSYAMTLSQSAPLAYITGQVFHFKANTANTGASTLNVNGLGALAIKRSDGVTDTVTGDIIVGQRVMVQYNGTNFTMLSMPAKPYISQTGEEIFGASSTGNDTYVVTLAPAPTAYVNGMVVRFKPDTANTGTASLNVNGLGAVTIVKYLSTTLSTGDIVANEIVEVIYNSTGNVFQMISPSAQTQTASSFVGTLTTGTSTTNQNVDTVFTTGFPPKVITIYYWLHGKDNSIDKYASGIAVYDSTGTLISNQGYSNTSGALSAGSMSIGTGAPTAGGSAVNCITTTLSVNAVSATSVTVRIAYTLVTSATGDATYLVVVNP